MDEILRGGPPRDGIPALDSPATVGAGSAPWRDDEMVVGVELPGGARAYPLAILVWHELINDAVGGRPILVSYCPLCGTAMVFDRRVDGAERHFGVSGLVYRSDLLMFDRETESLWSQISAESVTGPSLTQRLTLLRSKLRPWGEWKRAHPETTVLSAETGHRLPYGYSPYGGYDTSKRLLFPAPADPRYHPKMRTVGLRLPDGTARLPPRRGAAGRWARGGDLRGPSGEDPSRPRLGNLRRGGPPSGRGHRGVLVRVERLPPRRQRVRRSVKPAVKGGAGYRKEPSASRPSSGQAPVTIVW